MPSDPRDPGLAHGVPPIAVSSGSTLANRTGSWKYIQPLYQDRVAPCNAACPVGIDIEGFMDLLRRDRPEEARELLLRENPMPGVTGRLCERPCEGACNRRKFDDAVGIHAVERALGDLEPAARAAATPGREGRVAVVGSGPAGLACAYHLARAGYEVTVLEAEAEPGGWLRYGVPEYRLPRAVLAREIERVRAEGVRIRCGVRVGGGLSWDELREYDAVYLALGARLAEGLQLEGPSLAEVRPGADFLREVREGRPPAPGRRVVVLGGTETALDCARTAVRLGAEATVVCRGTREDLPVPAEVHAEAVREGVRFEFQAAVVGVRAAQHAEDEAPLEAIRTMFDAGEADDPRTRLVAVRCVRLRAPVPAGAGAAGEAEPEGGFELAADTLLAAQGGEPDLGFLPPDVHRRGFAVKTDEWGRTSRPGTFAGGDVAGGPRSVAHALGAGKRAAIGIDHWLRTRAGESPAPPDGAVLRYGGTGNASITRWRGDDPVHRTNEKNEVVPFEDLNMAYFTPEPAHHDRHRSPAEGGSGFGETNLGLGSAEALAEAKRCFNCGVCTNCEVCMILCPDVAIKRHSSGHGFSLSYKYCKGCGLCVEECPRGAMTMTREGL